MNASSTVEPIHAPELAMEDVFPVEGEANARTARTRERIDKHRGAQEVAREDEGNPCAHHCTRERHTQPTEQLVWCVHAEQEELYYQLKFLHWLVYNL